MSPIVKLSPVDTLRELVALPSVNPMGQPPVEEICFEHRVSDYLERLFRGWGLPYERQTVEPLRDNIVARLDGHPPASAGGPLLLLEAHQDTVPTTGMTIDPFDPVVRDGRVYGRGACDIKGGLAAMLAALSRLVDEPRAGRPTIVLAATVNEEHGFSGAAALTQLWSRPGGIFPRVPDGAVIAEPTELNVVVAHKGVVRWRCHAHGRAMHSSQPQLGDNAIFRMARVLAALETYGREVAPTLPEHALCGRPSLSVGTIHGGLSVNTVPDRCTIEIDRRFNPAETADGAYRHVIDHVARSLGGCQQIEHEGPFLVARGLPDDANGPLAERLASAARGVCPTSRRIGVPFGTNAAEFAAAGVPSVVFGPGSVAQAHTADEWLAIDQLEAAAEVLYRFAAGGRI